MSDPEFESTSVAIIAMAGRFPMTRDVDDLWRHLLAGDDLITRFPEAGDGHAVPAYGVTPEAEWFDAGFFGYSPAEALLLDPQQRVFLECCVEALECAGCDPVRYTGLIGVYGGSGASSHADRVRRDHAVGGTVPEWHVQLATGADFLTTRAAYKLGLRGPAVTVQTACSTSLVAVHLAVQAVLAGECDIALAGGVSIRAPYPVAIPEEGGIFAPDGYCRSFDARARGTVGADGAGVVVLKHLPDTLQDGDHIHAVIRGSAVSNDGLDKVGFTAPSVTGQAAAIGTAYAVAGVDVATVGYVEAHGTGTAMGDPIEIRALDSAFRAGTHRVGYCRVGSVKSNLGHTDTASGVIGLMKAALAVEHGVIPASLHVEEPNEEIDGSPFVVASELTPWPESAAPRRAGVNSLGIGGTNAHVVLEQAPEPRRRMPDAGPQLLPLSARSRQALADAVTRLADHLAANPGVVLADVAWTLQTGRREHEHRTHVVASDPSAATRSLRATAGRARDGGSPPAVTFLFPGQGGQHPGMGRELYAWSTAFSDRVDTCVDLLDAELGAAVRTTLLADPNEPRAFEATRKHLETMELAQPVLFVLEHALAGLWRSWGVAPTSVLGHSLGAYAAACEAGVLSTADALDLVVTRGRLLGSLPDGAMLAVPLSETEIEAVLPAELSVAAVNGAEQCVVSGPAAAVAAFEAELTGRTIETRRLRVFSAAHSHLVDSVLTEFGDRVRGMELRAPALPWISDTHGRLVTPDQARDPRYWVEHLRRTVRFGAALSTALSGTPGVLLEVGPGRTLTTLARHQGTTSAGHGLLASLPHAIEETSARDAVLDAAGGLWSHGVPLEWERLHHVRPHRVSLPTYPWQREHYAPSAEAVSAPPAPAPLDPSPVATAWPPGTEDERRLAAAFCEVLGLDEVAVDDNFFALGGDSLIAARLAGLIKRDFGIAVTVRTILLSPSVAELLPQLKERETREA
ncbi:beta-ketoacyl synthase N-terminal-like domain-containing protein [Streptomyces sp. WMMC500]|uniref:type I polyketide synthase n=1 Tax=Streptomyces sp. WMMC500 TaxID=3015154 RepID=UPI00248AA514|nr:beta-ketoacyl synthase N-terminal-like domain-containing protein [Streptomyces sp. WMMC500]WBB62052.1 beta-ketoacyl synthase N-terminal-like domain-containing protein [Streptomyces sp. WMMC500]